jgi:hypothetical protein
MKKRVRKIANKRTNLGKLFGRFELKLCDFTRIDEGFRGSEKLGHMLPSL